MIDKPCPSTVQIFALYSVQLSSPHFSAPSRVNEAIFSGFFNTLMVITMLSVISLMMRNVLLDGF